MDAIIKVRLINENGVICGPGTEMLFKAIAETGSVRRAAEKTDMSYTKAWKIIHDAENNTGLSLIKRNTGGRDGGSASLTENAVRLLEQYNHVVLEIEKAKCAVMEAL